MHFFTSALDGGEWLASRPGHFTSGYPLDMRLDAHQRLSGRCGEEKKSLYLRGIEPRSSSQFLSHYTD
jgi:hypothetical protein